ncbi:MAG TPA: glycosyltransferase family 9 protein [Puia sp.]|nr:glycosyltransferase family 9 protein [Puia sp.]
MQKFLIIQTAFIGDVVLATGLIEKLHNYFPDAEIDFLLRKGNEQLLTGHPFLHEILIWDKKQNKQRNLLRMLQRIRKNKYDKVINVQRFFATGVLTAFSGAKESIGFDKNPLSFLFSKKIKHQVGGEQSVHETIRNLALIREFTDDTTYKPKLYPSSADYDAVDEWVQSKFITISPASVWFTKQFPASQWLSFIKNIPATFTIYLLGGPGDVALCESIRETSQRQDLKVLAGSLSYLQSAALMSRASMNYVNDSAPMHFASAMNAPVTAIYCSTVPEFGFGPLSDTRHVVEIDHPLYCRPCGLHGYAACPEGHFKCALEIKQEQLKKTLPAV